MPTDPTAFRERSLQREPSFRMSTRQLGMWLFLACLAVLFLASIVAYLITRYNHPQWSQAQATLPGGLLAAGGFLAGTSIFFELALRGIKANNQARLRTSLMLAGLFGLAFLVAQSLNWASVMSLNAGVENRLISLFIFYMLTTVHALHVIGGFVPLGIVWYRAGNREYSSSRWEGVALCAQYWHFLGIIWVLLMVTMYGTRG